MKENVKLNFWQILGIVLLLVGIVYIIRRETGVSPATPVEPTAPPSQVLPSAGERVPSH